MRRGAVPLRTAMFVTLLVAAVSCVAPSAPAPTGPARPDSLGGARLAPDAGWADHFITYADDPVDSVMDSYRGAGFLASTPERTVRHHPGLRNGFVMIGPDYLEICWVEREEEFEAAAEKEAYFRELRKGRRPYGIGFQALDPEAFRRHLADAGGDVPEVTFARPQDAPEDTPPTWAFGSFPEGSLRGAHTFYLSYLERAGDRNGRLWMGSNGIYLVVGVLFVTDKPERRARAWSAELGPGSERRGEVAMQHGPHAYLWVRPDEWEMIADRPLPPSTEEFHELTAIVALSEDLDATIRALRDGGVPVLRRAVRLPIFGTRDALVVHPSVRTGFPMIVLEGDRAAWTRWREEVQGIPMELRTTL